MTYDPQGDSSSSESAIVSGKLFISCSSKPDVAPWVYYLKGEPGSGTGSVSGSGSGTGSVSGSGSGSVSDSLATPRKGVKK